MASGDGLAGRNEVYLSLPKTFLWVSGSAVAMTAAGMLCNSMSSHLVDRQSSLVFGHHLSSWYTSLLLCMSHCLLSNLTSPSGCQSKIRLSGNALNVPAGQTNKNGFSDRSWSIPNSVTIWGSIVEKS